VIRNSVVAKLWLTIISLFIVVLLLLSVFLEQLFDNYFLKAEEERLTARMDHMAEVLTNPNYSATEARLIINELALEENAEEPLKFDRTSTENLVSRMKPEDLATLVSGKPVIERGTSPYWETKLVKKDESFWVLEPLIVQHEIVGLLFVVQPITAAQAVGKLRELLFFSAGLGVVLATGLTFVVSKNLSNPLVQMNKVAKQMIEGDFHGKVNVVTQDEVGMLGNSLNTLADKLEENIDDLEREKEQLASIITSMSDGVISADLNGAITLANPQARRMIRAQLLMETGDPSAKQLPRDLADFENSVMKNRQSLFDELHWQGRVLVVTMAPLYEKDGETLRGCVAVLRDVTEERTIEKMRKDFIANVSHELRTPLAMMQGYSEALLDEFGDDPEQRQELTQIILDETHRMRRLVNDLLNLAQLESGQFQMSEEELDMVHLVRRVGRKFATVSNEREVRLDVVVDEQQAPVLVYGDPDRLEQVFTNLVDNAFRHTLPGGRLTLQLTADETLVHILVRDTGEGIPQEDLPFVFERFYKVDKARTRSKGGTGLGLAITHNIVKSHHGDIVVESEIGKGTTFNVILPRYNG
jgi:two-component system sensor histidine kinase ResE